MRVDDRGGGLSRRWRHYYCFGANFNDFSPKFAYFCDLTADWDKMESITQLWFNKHAIIEYMRTKITIIFTYVCHIIYRVMVLYRLSKTCYFDFLSYYITLFGITSSFWYYFHTFSHIASSFWYYFLTFSHITSSFWYYFHTFGHITSPFWCYFHTFSRLPPLLYCWQQQIQNDSTFNSKHSAFRIQSVSLIWKWTPCQNISLCLKFCIL